MDLDQDMAATVAPHMPSEAEIARNTWMPDAELAIYVGEYQRTGFQGGLQWYRCRTEGVEQADLQLFSGRTIDVPSMFVAGRSDWGVYQVPGTFEVMREKACTRMMGCHLIEGAGHWVQQEQAPAVAALLLDFLRATG
jgi:pimeloyl-ACP methyl ester carboxylesterase